MGDLTLNISKHELQCQCGKCNVRIQDHEPVINIVQNCCDHFAELYDVEKVRLDITSAARCYEYNRIPDDDGGPGSNDDSQHPRCNAMDIKIFVKEKQVPPSQVYMYFIGKFKDKYGIGKYNTFTHIDTRAKKSRW